MRIAMLSLGASALIACGDATAPMGAPDSLDCGAATLWIDADSVAVPERLPWTDLQDALAYAQVTLLPSVAAGSTDSTLARALGVLRTEAPPAPQSTCNALANAARAWQLLAVTPDGAPEREALRLVLELFVPYTGHAR